MCIRDSNFAGKSTVKFDSEIFTHPAPPGTTQQPAPDGGVYGPGPRVPMLVLSPWSRGGWVNSQAFDHTSVLQFLEKRFQVREPNISAWRRAVCGDLTSAFNFVNPNTELLPPLHETTRRAADLLRQRQEQLAQVVVPAEGRQQAPHQARMARPSRALPYQLNVEGDVDRRAGELTLNFFNHGEQGAVFHVYDRLHLEDIPRRYTVGAEQHLSDTWPVAGGYDLWLLGPNGFHRSFKGDLQRREPELSVAYQGDSVQLTVINPSKHPASVTIKRCPYTHQGPWLLEIAGHSSQQRTFSRQPSGGWYDFTVRNEHGWVRRVAGRVETGAHSISDPLMGKPV